MDFLQQNWAVIQNSDDGCVVFFFGDDASIFDQIDFTTPEEAKLALLRNGFKEYDKDKTDKKFICKPKPPFKYRVHPNGPIYSSGRFWK